MWIGLVTHVPNNGIGWTVKNPVQNYGKLHHAKVARQMSTVLSHHVDYLGAYLVGQNRQLFLGYPF